MHVIVMLNNIVTVVVVSLPVWIKAGFTVINICLHCITFCARNENHNFNPKMLIKYYKLLVAS